mmetsp:Transcript_22319/g.10705  ORF Transcript_22319/g.10705 Transcript_22319/m.10705 type:complete len:211 (+) Transcript_22319:361-993(+)
MIRGLIGKKIGMSSLFTREGKCCPVTIIEVGPCAVTQIKRESTDGYNALQLGFGSKKSSKINKPLAGHLKKSGGETYKILKEFAVENSDDYSLGQKLTVGMFTVGDSVQVSGTTKGRGFAGVMKRHGFGGGKKSHGSHSHRIPGSIGCSASPAKVIRGKKMPGHYGACRHTVKNLKIVDIKHDKNLILIKGAVPGAKLEFIEINKPKFTK